MSDRHYHDSDCAAYALESISESLDRLVELLERIAPVPAVAPAEVQPEWARRPRYRALWHRVVETTDLSYRVACGKYVSIKGTSGHRVPAEVSAESPSEALCTRCLSR